MNSVYEKLKNCYDSVRAKTSFEPKVALVLGSGLGKFAEEIDVVNTISYAEIDMAIELLDQLFTRLS